MRCDLCASICGGLVLHGPVTADIHVIGDELPGFVQVLACQFWQQLVNQVLELIDEFTFETAVGSQAEDVEFGTTQAAHARQQAHRQYQPGAEFHLVRPAAGVFLARDQWWRQVEAHPGFVAVRFANRVEKTGLRVQPRNLILVLVAEQSEVAACDRFSQAVVVGGITYMLDKSEVAVSKCLVLVIDEKFGAVVDDVVEVFIQVRF